MKPSVCIEQLHLTGDLSQKNALLSNLDLQSWPGEDSEKVYYIQRLEVKGAWWELGDKAAELARSAYSEAVHGSCVEAPNAQFVYFNSQAEKNAYFIRDVLSAGKLPWYWQGENVNIHDPSALVLECLKESAIELPEVFRFLEPLKLVDRVFAILTAEQVKALLSSVCAATGWRIVGSSQSSEPRKLVNVESDAEIKAKLHLADIPSWIKKSIDGNKWLEPYVSQELISEHLYLYALILSWRHDCRFLVNASNFNQLIEFVKISVEARHFPQKNLKTESSDDKKTRSGDEQYTSCSEPNTSDSIDVRENIVRNPEPTPENIQPLIEGLPVSFECISQNASIFFGLNIINRFITDEMMSTDSHLITVLYSWVEYLDIRLDEGAKRAVCYLLNIENIDDLHEIERADIDPAVFDTIQSRLEKYDFWPDAWANISGLIRINDAHIDVYFHLNSVELSMRLAGLDVDPGWLPRIGRVVKFYYGQEEGLLK